MSNMKQFKSILDYKLQVKNIVDALVPDIQFSYYAIINNSTIQTYFNMISMELYGFEYNQILRLNDLQFKIDEKTINPTILEMVYNILKVIVGKKLRYSEYIAYDIYILPIRIEKYLNAMGYRLNTFTTVSKKVIYKLVSDKSRVVTEDVMELHHDDKLNAMITMYRSTPITNPEEKLATFNHFYLFLKEAELIVSKYFDRKFSDEYFAKLKKFKDINLGHMTDKDKTFVKNDLDNFFNVSMTILMLLSDSKISGVWDGIQAEQRKLREIEAAKKTIETAEKKLMLIDAPKKAVKVKS